MPLPEEKVFSKYAYDINERVKASFAHIREDINDMETSLSAMRDYLKKKDKGWTIEKKEEAKLREEFASEVEEFKQKVTQLKLVLSEIRAIRNEVVIRKDLSKIEERIRSSFKEEIEGYKEKVNSLKDLLREAEKRIGELEKGSSKRIKSVKKRRFFG